MAGLITMAPPMAPTSSPEPPQQTNTNTTNSPVQTPTSTSLLVGFLISFLALFVVFLGCGLSSRYMVDRRRQRLRSESLYRGEPKDEQPVLCDIWTVLANNEWKDMMPLSVEVRKDLQRTPPAAADRVDPRVTTEEAIGLYRELTGRNLRWAMRPRRRPRSSYVGSSAKLSGGDENVDLQITVLVALPSESRHARGVNSVVTGRETAPEGLENIRGRGPDDDTANIALGVVTIPWDKQRLDFG